jgi:hypothetical protein
MIVYPELFSITCCKDAWVVGHFICNSEMEIFFGIFSLQDQCMIGRWKWFLLPSSCCILKE